MCRAEIPAASSSSSGVPEPGSSRLTGVEGNLGAPQTLLHIRKLAAILDGDVSPGRRPMVGIGAQVDLRAVVGFKPSGAHPLQPLVHLDQPVAEDVNEERRLSVDAVREHPEIDMVKMGHGQR